MKNFIYSMLGSIAGSIIYQVGLLLVVDSEVRMAHDISTHRNAE